jgi:chaperonin GroEL
MKKIHKLGKDARDALKRGIDFCAAATNPSLGPSGRAAILGRVDLPPRIADDAISIVMNIELDDESEQEGVMLMRETLANTSKKVKDSTASTMNLSAAIVNAVFNELKSSGSLVASKKINTIKMKKVLDSAVSAVVEKIKEHARPMTEEDIYNVALSAGSYEWVAELTAEIFKKIGKYGFVNIKEGNKTSYEIFNGIDIDAGYHSDYYSSSDNRLVLDNVPVIVTNNQIDTAAVTKVIAGCIANKIHKAIIIAPDFTRQVLTEMVISHTETNPEFQFTAVALKLPTYGKDDTLLDIAAMTKAKFLDKNIYADYHALLDDIKYEHFGLVKSAVITDSKTKLIGGNGDVSSRVAEIKQKLENTESIFDKDSLEKRLAGLTGGVAYITVGGNSDFEKGYFKLKLENAIGSVQNAFKHGVVKGGGCTLKQIAEELPENILTKALKSPYETIQDNNGEPFDISDVVIDSAINVITSLESAASVAGTLLLTEFMTSFKKQDERQD